jgi:hypothetical protein
MIKRKTTTISFFLVKNIDMFEKVEMIINNYI